MTPTPSPTTAAPDLWYHYGKNPAAREPHQLGLVPTQCPGDELLDELTGLAVAELGSGGGHQAAYITTALEPAQLVGLDSSLTQHTHSQRLHGHIPGLEFVHTDASAFLSDRPQTLDVAYSLFGALDLSDPQILLAALATALRPGGRLVFSTLGHYSTGAAPATKCRPADVSTRLADGAPATMERWVLSTPVWEKLLSDDFELLDCESVRDPGPVGAPPMATTIFRARRRSEPATDSAHCAC